MREIDFSQIDGKEEGVLYGMQHERNPENLEIFYKAQLEYFERLDLLQKEIANKYNPLFIQNDDANLPDTKELWDIEDNLDNKYSSKKYDHLWYS